MRAAMKQLRRTCLPYVSLDEGSDFREARRDGATKQSGTELRWRFWYPPLLRTSRVVDGVAGVVVRIGTYPAERAAASIALLLYSEARGLGKSPACWLLRRRNNEVADQGCPETFR